jgi:DNA-binding CsgD family transcriptional regulator
MWQLKNAYLYLLIILLQPYHFGIAQSTSFPVDQWTQELSVQDDVQNKNFLGIVGALNQYDSTAVYKVFNALDKKASNENHYFNARLFLLKAFEYKRINFPKGLSLVKQLFEQALLESYATDNTKLMSFVSWQYGEYMYAYQQIELAATYGLTAADLNEDVVNANLLGEILFHAGDYTRCIYYTKQAIDRCKDTSLQTRYVLMRSYNTLGQGYRKNGQLDSALLCYEKSFSLSQENKDSVWRAINCAFMGEVFVIRENYEKAKPLLEDAYRINKIDYPNLSGFALQWLARIDLAENKRDSALLRVKEALILARERNEFGIQNRSILENVYSATADIYRSFNKTDSFYRYFQLYSNLHDSLQGTLIIRMSEIAKLRLDNQKNFQAIQALQHEKVLAEQQRNFIVLAILMVALSALLILNRQRQKLKFKQQLALQEKAAAKAEVAAAQEQLQMFTQNIIEKSGLIEKLEQQLRTNESNGEHEQLIVELTHQTILTENDWEKFKMLFEKIHPRFFLKLKEKVPDITIAEQRMAALSRLQLTTKQMAALLGISPNSVNKTKQRLRQRFHLQTDASIEAFVAGL